MRTRRVGRCPISAGASPTSEYSSDWAPSPPPVPTSGFASSPVEPLDIDIIREMYREGVVNLAGVDPRLNASRIAQRLKVGRARVSGRLRFWDRIGFLRRYDVWLNPTLLGWQGAWVSVRVDHPRRKPEVLRQVGLVDGVVSALDFLGEWLSVGLLGPDRASILRRVALIRGFTGVTDVDGPIFWQPPTPRRPLTPLDLRILRALRERPTATLSETARRVGVSTRTMTRRYAELVGDWAVWFVPVFDFSVLAPPVVSLTLALRPGTPHEPILRALRRPFPLLLETRPGSWAVDGSTDTLVAFLVLPSAARMEDLHRLAEGLDGVQGVELLTMVRMHAFPEWFDQHLASLTRPAPRAPHAAPGPLR